MTEPPIFDGDFARQLRDLIVWRRDVRHFKSDPLDEGLVDEVLRLACLSPSVGNSQPWRFVRVEDATRRAAVRAIFESCNAEALRDYQGEQARLYASLKLAGLDKAPVQMAVFVETAPEEGAGLGRKTMPQTLHYSVAGAVQTLFLVARAHGVGVGMISILDPQAATAVLEVPPTWELVAYLCLGYPEMESPQPELERLGWQGRVKMEKIITKR